MEWLIREQIRHHYMPRAFPAGPGDLAPDFVVQGNNGEGAAWLIQGTYYHSPRFQAQKGQQGRDERARLMLTGRVVNGVRIKNVIEIKEEDLYRRREDVLRAALAGYGWL